LTDWVVATKIDKNEALAETVALRNSMIGIVLAASVGIVIIAIFFTQVFTRPILRIARVSERIGRGDFAARANIRRQDELGALASSVDAMGANLNGMVGNIEHQRMRLQIILDSTTETIFAIDESATIILVNRSIQSLLMAEPDTFVGKNMSEIFAFKHGLQDFVVNYDVEGVHTYTDLKFTDPKGTQRYIKLIVSRIKDEMHAGKAHAIVTIHDETSSHDLENMKTDFVSMAAHELRTPLTAVRGYLEMVQYKQAHNDPSDVESYVRQALKNVSDLGGLINNLLDVTRIERGTLTLSMEKVDLAEEMTRVMEGQRFAAEDRQLTMVRHGIETGGFVAGDPIALREVLDNLLSNAIKYTKPGGRIDITLSQSDKEYVVEVKDTGIGIPAKSFEYLFTKFYRVHGGLDSGSTGTGLGLFIAKSIVERHRGTIQAESKEGVGSTFTYTLPVYSDELLKRMQPSSKNNETAVRRKRGWVTKNITR
jgi:PAS domain S-box-containing protein